jgi:hypothetical protein
MDGQHPLLPPMGATMPRLAFRSAMLLASLLAGAQASVARAAEEDTQFWLTAFVRGKLGKDVFLTLDTGQRWREGQIGPDQQNVRATFEVEVAPRLRLGAGGAVFETAGATELRPHQQIRYINGGWDLRTRLEQRFLPGAQRTELRIRQRVQYSRDVSDKVELIGSVEWFGVIEARSDRRDPDGVEQIRFIVAAAFDVGGGVEVQPGYLLWYSPEAVRTDTISHVPQVAINYRF